MLPLASHIKVISDGGWGDNVGGVEVAAGGS